MLKNLYDYYFWFAQPSTILTGADQVLGFVFLASLLLAIILGAWSKFISHDVNKKLVRKFFTLALNLGIAGLFWLGVRFENIPILAERFWAGAILLLGLIWFLFILKYLGMNYRREKSDYEKEVIKSKYIAAKR